MSTCLWPHLPAAEAGENCTGAFEGTAFGTRLVAAAWLRKHFWVLVGPLPEASPSQRDGLSNMADRLQRLCPEQPQLTASSQLCNKQEQ